MNSKDILDRISGFYPQWVQLFDRLTCGAKSDWEILVLDAFLCGVCDVVSSQDEAAFWKDIETLSVEDFLLIAMKPSGLRWTSLGYWLLRIGFTRSWIEERACSVFGVDRKTLTDEELHDFFSFLILTSVFNGLRSKELDPGFRIFKVKRRGKKD